jgi:hypothetical protein
MENLFETDIYSASSVASAVCCSTRSAPFLCLMAQLRCSSASLSLLVGSAGKLRVFRCAIHCCTFHNFTPTVTGLAVSGLIVGNARQHMADWYSEMCSPGPSSCRPRLHTLAWPPHQ